MRRRQLRLQSSSDEDDEAQTLITPNPNPNPTAPPDPPSPPLEISDDDFVDVPDGLSDPSPPPPPPPPPILADHGEALSGSLSDGADGSAGPIDEFLRRFGLRLRREWLASCVSGLERSGLGFEGMDVAGKAKMCFERFLVDDMNYCGAGVLPANVSGMHKVELEGPFVLQVDEVVNISSPLRERYHDAPAGLKRSLKLSLTDGVQRVVGMEYRPIKELEALGPAGLKIIIHNIQIRRGLLLLVPEILEILGGLVEDLEAARRRLVDEVNKPPRGRRKQHGLSLSKIASLAAWPPNNTNDGAAQTNVSMPQNQNNRQATSQAANLATSGSEPTIIGEFGSIPIGSRTVGELTAQDIEGSFVREFAAPQFGQAVVEEPMGAEEFGNIPIGNNTTGELTSREIEEIMFQEFAAPHAGRILVEEPASCERKPDADHGARTVIEAPAFAKRKPDTETNLAVYTTLHEEGIHVSDVEDTIDEVEHPIILSGEREIPFTYLACLLARWTTQKDHIPFVQGKIKCVLTGVKGFQFRQRSTYELHVYVDDGSLISEVLIDHHVVEKGIGHSPMEVTAALSSSDKETMTDMKDAMKKFQLFLAKFEGTMLLEMNENSSFPVALEMNQGCSTSDAWMLLSRLQKVTAPQEPHHRRLNHINLSP